MPDLWPLYAAKIRPGFHASNCALAAFSHILYEQRAFENAPKVNLKKRGARSSVQAGPMRPIMRHFISVSPWGIGVQGITKLLQPRMQPRPRSRRHRNDAPGRCVDSSGGATASARLVWWCRRCSRRLLADVGRERNAENGQKVVVREGRGRNCCRTHKDAVKSNGHLGAIDRFVVGSCGSSEGRKRWQQMTTRRLLRLFFIDVNRGVEATAARSDSQSFAK
ncbi:hypothetical protein IWZ03DRAFT_38248 [Phyllosticta citriasiana]|uniref:Uncharacterized protein n=1 Tax=Phyllosticta citriasiana TaxID=595635 RepID=A0ABR1KD86_9PEZI